MVSGWCYSLKYAIYQNLPCVAKVAFLTTSTEWAQDEWFDRNQPSSRWRHYARGLHGSRTTCVPQHNIKAPGSLHHFWTTSCS